MNLIITGPQGAGKGTQAKLLAKRFKLAHLSIGQLFRNEASKNSAQAKKIAKVLNKGKLLPLDITQKILSKELKNKKYKKGIILDGFPRDKSQLKLLNKLIKIDYVIVINLTQKESIRRLSCRLICPDCGETYNVCVRKPKNNMVCNECKTGLVRRKDDYPQAIKKRLNIYKKNTLPVINHFDKLKKLIKVKGDASINQVSKRILSKLKEKGIK